MRKQIVFHSGFTFSRPLNLIYPRTVRRATLRRRVISGTAKRLSHFSRPVNFSRIYRAAISKRRQRRKQIVPLIYRLIYVYPSLPSRTKQRDVSRDDVFATRERRYAALFVYILLNAVTNYMNIQRHTISRYTLLPFGVAYLVAREMIKKNFVEKPRRK